MLPINLLMAFSGKGGQVYSLANLASEYADESTITDTYTVNFIVRDSITDGTIDVTKAITSSELDEETYIVPTGSSVWVRATYVSGDTFTSGAAVGSWLELSTDRTWTMSHTTSGGLDQISGIYKFELATDSGGSNIVADSGNITFRVGETS